MFVELLIPDTTAITTFKTLKEMGFEIEGLKRYDYYNFEHENENFFERISKVDVLVNANKHKAVDTLETEDVKVIVKDIPNPGEGLLGLLSRLGFEKISKVEKGVCWVLKLSNKEDAEKIVKDLLANEHYQEYLIE